MSTKQTLSLFTCDLVSDDDPVVFCNILNLREYLSISYAYNSLTSMNDTLLNATKLQHGVFQSTTMAIDTIELGYNDLGLCVTSAITSYVLWYQLIPCKAVLFCTA
jgi:hypothetical protein